MVVGEEGGTLKLSSGRTVALSGLVSIVAWRTETRNGCKQEPDVTSERIDRRIPETAKWAKSSRAHGAIKH